MADPNDRFKVDLELLDEAVSVMEPVVGQPSRGCPARRKRRMGFGTEVDTWLEDLDRQIAELHQYRMNVNVQLCPSYPERL
ncbi:hypothetical protein J2W56_006615 [Nocardia kruczakiae]|uniref:Uncharacterized protein n=1 Tax=Nocardia kruczakiae TaxID=261477 RepID=A0ABU1XR49_9NOCA|nr:hypothetical protein [Nocardia kruczakiae]MDR7172849.1 hypothetical protein [Nocardia kruczakiae]